jgi:hypothetical protein
MTNFERGVVLDQWTQWLAPGNGRHKPNVRCRCVILGLGQCWRPWWRRDRVGRSSSSSSSSGRRRRRRVARSEPRQKRNEACAAAVELPAGGHPGHQPELRVQPKALQVIEYATHTHAYTCTSAPILCVWTSLALQLATVWHSDQRLDPLDASELPHLLTHPPTLSLSSHAPVRTSDGNDVTIDVSVSVNIRQLISINVEDQTFRAEVFIRSSWVSVGACPDPSFSHSIGTARWQQRFCQRAVPMPRCQSSREIDHTSTHTHELRKNSFVGRE